MLDDTGIGDNLHDVFIIAAVFSRTREVGLEEGALYSQGNAGEGCPKLLQNMREEFGSECCLLPPLNLGAIGYREAVGVFYNSTKLQFTGPNLFFPRYEDLDILQGQPVNRETYGEIIDYPRLWKNCLPNNPIRALRKNRTYDFTIGGQQLPNR